MTATAAERWRAQMFQGPKTDHALAMAKHAGVSV
jgi:hypothetical protein